MNFRLIKVNELTDFVESFAFQNFNVVPITPLRALSQAKNPNAKANDVVLVYAENTEGQIVSYIGCLPDKLNEAETERICWCSCWWSHPTKGRTTTMQVFYKMLEVWDANMLFDDLPNRSVSILKQMNFFHFKQITGIQYFLRFKFKSIIPNRIPSLQTLKPVFSITDILLNAFVDTKNKVWKNYYHQKKIVVKPISKISTELSLFIIEHSNDDLISRSLEVMNWIIDYPWLNQNTASKNKWTNRYYFSSYAEQFENTILTVYKENEIIGFLWFSLRDGEAKLPYIYFKSAYLKTIADVILEQLLVLKANTFICYHPLIANYFKHKISPAYYSKEVKKVFGYTQKLEQYFTKEKQIQDGDGDVVFT